jgi:FMN phosphatase YigB (HAD superfamily)
MFRLVITDLAGIFLASVNEYSLLKNILKFKGTAQSLKAYMGDSYDKLFTGKMKEMIFWNNLIKKTGSKKKMASIKKEFLKSFKPIFDIALFQKAKENFKFALCTDFYHPWLEEIKKSSKFSFDYESISSKTGIKKSSKEAYLGAMLNFKLKPEECLVVSDEISDLKLAKELGMHAMLIPGKSKEFKDADYVYEKFDDFLKILA